MDHPVNVEIISWVGPSLTVLAMFVAVCFWLFKVHSRADEAATAAKENKATFTDYVKEATTKFVPDERIKTMIEEAANKAKNEGRENVAALRLEITKEFATQTQLAAATSDFSRKLDDLFKRLDETFRAVTTMSARAEAKAEVEAEIAPKLRRTRARKSPA